MFQMFLTTYFEGLTFIFSVITGYEAVPTMVNPLFESQSVREFWGERWNILIHTALKNGVYKPLRWKCSVPRAGASIATFLASGAFHEWILYLLYTTGSEDGSRKHTYTPIYGEAMLFFILQGVLIELEVAFSKTALGRTMDARLPRPLKRHW